MNRSCRNGPTGARGRGRFLRETAGSAAVEFVLWLAVLIVPLLSAVDVGTYAYNRLLVQLAGQAAVQAVWRACDVGLNKVPATAKCTTPNTALLGVINSAAQATTLGTAGTTANANGTQGHFFASPANKTHLPAPTNGSPP